MLEGEVGGPRSKSCQGFGAKAGVRSSFFGKVGFGGRGGRIWPGSPLGVRTGKQDLLLPVPCSWES